MGSGIGETTWPMCTLPRLWHPFSKGAHAGAPCAPTRRGEHAAGLALSQMEQNFAGTELLTQKPLRLQVDSDTWYLFQHEVGG